MSGFDNPNTNQVDTLAVSGLSQPYRLVWTPVSYSFSSSFDLLGTNSQCSQGSVSTGGTLDAVSEVDLPNGQSFQISYAVPSGAPSYATITKITTAGGATISYTWGIEADADYTSLNWQGSDPTADSGPTYWNFNCEYHYGAPVVTDRSVSLDGTHEILHQHFDYTVNWGSGAGQWGSRQTTETDTITNPDGSTRTRKIVYSYLPGSFRDPRAPNSTTAVGSSPAAESSVEYFEGGAGSPERMVSKTWFNGDVRELGSETVSLNGEPVSMAARCYDANYQVVDVDEYGGANDGSGVTSLPDCATNQSMPTPPGPLLRQTVTDYAAASSAALAAAHIDDLPSSRIVCNGSRQPVAATDFSYDGTSVTSSGVAVGRDTSYNGNTSMARGNLTAQTRWTTVSGTACSASGVSKSGPLTSNYAWDDAGQPLSFTDPGQHTTTYTWGDAAGSPGGTDGFLLQVQYPDTSSPNLAHHVESYTWDYLSGHLLSHTDQNGEVTSYQYNDSLGRLTQITDPLVPVNGGGTDNPVTKVSYSDTAGNLYTEIQRKIDSSTWTDEYTLYDGLGRAVSHSRVDPDNGWDRTDTGYDGLGRVGFRSYPCPASTPTGAAVCTAGDTFSYDALGRTLSVTHSDQSQITTSYWGGATEVQDEGNGSYRVTHVYQHDGLGRLVSVCEADGETGAGTASTPVSCSNQIAGFPQDLNLTGFETGYSYDALGNLNRVQQPGLEDRTFSYDSLSRLLSASNPEAGTTNYVWDNWNAALCGSSYSAPGDLVEIDKPTVTVCQTWDALHRLRRKGYDDGVTPTAWFNYDESTVLNQALTNTVGRLSSATVNNSGDAMASPGELFSYDALGRVTSNGQDPGNGTLEELDSGYDLVGDRTGESSGAGVTFTASFNRAGRLTGLSSSAGPASLVSGATWFAFGGLHTATLGSGVHETRDYDGRQRLTSLSAQAPLAQYTLNYTLGLGWAPDGVLTDAQDVVNGGWSYTYDALNRLVDATCSGTASAPCAGEANPLELTWSYDRQGNRWTQAVAAGTGTAASASFSGKDNRLDGDSYDAAGNLLASGTVGQPDYRTYTWDAEGRLIGVGGDATASYVYDAAGRRVRRTANGTTVDDLLGPDGRVRSEYDESRQAWTRTEIAAGGLTLGSYNPQTGATALAIADELGTVRARTDLAGNVQERYTSLPFGDLLTTWNDNWQPTSPEVGAISPLHFTGQPRDEETGLDDFGARLYSSSLGRWMTPDWSAQAEPVPYAKLDNPQSLNLYAYVLNNPVTSVDKDGHTCDICEAAMEEVDAVVRPLVESAVATGEAAGASALGAVGLVLTPTQAGGPNDVVHFAPSIQQMGPKRGSKGGPGAGKRAAPGQRKKALNQNGGKCVFCGEPAKEADHAYPRSRGGNNSAKNLQPTCTPCNRQKGSKTSQEYLDWKKRRDIP